MSVFLPTIEIYCFSFPKQWQLDDKIYPLFSFTYSIHFLRFKSKFQSFKSVSEVRIYSIMEAYKIESCCVDRKDYTSGKREATSKAISALP